MYKGAWGPSILQVLIFALYTFLSRHSSRSYVPGVPRRRARCSGWALWGKCLRGIIPSADPDLRGARLDGRPAVHGHAIATPTEAGAMGVVGALVLAAIHRRLTWPLMWEAMDGTMRLTAMVVFILIGSRVFSLVFQGVDGAKWVEHMLTRPAGRPDRLPDRRSTSSSSSWPSSSTSSRSPSSSCRCSAPVAAKLGIDLVWFGVLLCVNMQTCFMHPPFGFALFYLRGIADTLFKDKRCREDRCRQRHLPGCDPVGRACSCCWWRS